ncbi:sensor histidine kinase [Pseudooceanicola sp. 200-1SW]|uniref:sensor histidine kinase n=1 Tax=Pseudooceanicola sp. 200-1SW TaxID=3425949 RepID=UPI003D7F7374
MSRAAFWRTTAPVLLLLVCIGLLVFGFLRLRAIEKSMRLDDATNMVWVISQAQVEALKLRAVLAEAPGDGAVIAHQYDLFRSRMDMLTQGPQRRFLEEFQVATQVMAAQRLVHRLDPAVRQLAPFEEQALSRELVELNRQLNRAANRAMVGEWRILSDRLARYRTAVAQVAYSLAVGVLVAIYLGWRIVADRRARLDAEELRLRSARLEEDLDRERATVAHWRDFAAVVSHQFRTPLAVIDSAAQRIYRRGQPASEEVLEAKQATIREMVGSLDRLVDAALLIGRIDNKMERPQQVIIDLAPTLRGIVDEMQRRHRGREITLSLGEGPLSAWCDPKLVQHGVMNLIDNAVKYSPPSSPVEVSLFQQEGRVACAVADRGPGLTEEEAARLFARFQRGEDAPASGTGIGLWLAQRLALLQGGRIEAQRRTGGGALFTLWLPATPPGKKGQET